MSDDVHEVYAICYGTHARKRSENYIFGDPHDEMTSIAYYVWVIQGPHGIFVCDTGFDEVAAKERARVRHARPVSGIHDVSALPNQRCGWLGQAGHDVTGLDQPQLRKRILVMLGGVRREAAEYHPRHAARPGSDFGRNGADGYARGKVGWKTIDAGRDRGVCDRFQLAGRGQIEGGTVTARQQGLFVLATAGPYRSDRVDDVPGFQPVPARDLGRAGVAAAEGAAFFQQLRPGGAMDRAVDAATAEQGAVRRIHDRIDIKRGDVGDNDLENGLPDLGGEFRHA